MSWGDPGRVSRWRVGDKIVDCRRGKPRTIKDISIRLSFSVVRTTQGHTIVAEDLDFWDLVIPELTWTGKTYDERRRSMGAGT